MFIILAVINLVINWSAILTKQFLWQILYDKNLFLSHNVSKPKNRALIIIIYVMEIIKYNEWKREVT